MRGIYMKTKFIVVRLDYDTDETWEITHKEVEEMLKMFNNLKRHAKIERITRYDNDDGKNK